MRGKPHQQTHFLYSVRRPAENAAPGRRPECPPHRTAARPDDGAGLGAGGAGDEELITCKILRVRPREGRVAS